ncbi:MULTISPECIES: MarR family winged helix-turn-helix transcriptional regulator [Streptomyces]|uniref:MarR family winged helix-turn-helix transcriptional regulator n=1 Tax=Streptomyces nondiastaticus TaxID=3154512 RepID=A0ABW6TV69_9ACTN|nr:MarR family transcriptional regulator [Streptomyces sp. VNUA116]WKU44739.1 MarR family transcriptional regulator [Streptomyces sp. VNUA116]
MTAHDDTHAATAERAWGQLREIVLGGNERRKEVVDALGMSFFRIKALRRIARGPLTLRELAEQLLTDRPYATLVVDDLAARGLVERTANPADRRSKIVSVTPAGKETAARAERILGTPPPALLALPAEDLAELERITSRLAGHGS